MASTAGQISRDLFCFDFRRLVAACAPRDGQGDTGAAPFADENLTTRAVASAGLAALFALPFLLLSSVVLAAPLAVPAAIGLGYLAMSHALASRHRLRAAFINALVLCGLVGWLLLFLLAGDGTLSSAGLTAALLAPLFAAAPAVARSFMPKLQTLHDPAVLMMRNAALDRVASLDELMPNEQMLVLDADGTVLAATAAARKNLPLLPDAFEHHLNSLFDASDLARLQNALDQCKRPEETLGGDLAIDLDGGRLAPLDGRAMEGRGRSLAATLSACSDGTFAMRVQERRTIEPVRAAAGKKTALCAAAAKSVELATRPSCDIGEALAFALRHAGSKAKAMQVALTSTIEPNLVIACDRQIGRRILHHLIDSALSGSQGGGAVHVFARRLKGVVLLRAASDFGTDVRGAGADSDGRLNDSTLRILVESAGGTLVVDRDGHDIALSVRLDLAADEATRTRMEQSA